MPRALFVALLALAAPALLAQPEIFARPMSKAEEARKFHRPDVRGMSAEERLEAYAKRLDLEAKSLWGGLNWVSVGPEIQSGRVVDIESPAGDPKRLFVAFATGGLHVTEDEGTTWTSLFDTESAFAIGDVAVSRDGKTVWVGTGENNSQRTSYSGTGLFKSTDGGKTWANTGLAETHRIGRIQIDPHDENVVYVGALGSLYSQNPARGVYKTTDGGKTWRHVLKLDEHTGVIDLKVDPKNPKTLYAVAWDRDRRAWNFRESGPGSALYKTTDGGMTWTKLGAGVLPQGDAMGRAGITISPQNPNRVYLLVDNQGDDLATPWRDEGRPGGVLTPSRFAMLNDDLLKALDTGVLQDFLSSFGSPRLDAEQVKKDVDEGKSSFADLKRTLMERNPRAFEYDIVNSQVWRSDDGGKSWTKPHPGNLGEILGYYCGRIEVSPHNADEVWVTGVLMIRSLDGGKTWKRAAERMHSDYHAVFFDPRDPRRVAVGNDGGLYVSGDGGQNYRHWNNLAVGQFTTIAVDDKVPYNIYGGLQDNGTMRGPSNYVPGRSAPSLWTSIGGGDGSAVAVDPRNGGDVVYVASQFGSHSALEQSTGRRWNARANAGRGEPELRYNWISPLIVSPHHPDIVYLGAQKVFRSLNQGRTWEAISDDITKDRPNGDVPFSTLKDLSESPFKFGLIYAGADDGTVKVTKNHGFTWEDVSTPTPDKWVSRVVASKHDPATVYVAQSGYREDDFAPYLWKSTDYGATWTSIIGNLPNETINVVREDPKNPRILYVGTDLGVWVTFDGGSTWEPLAGGLPRTPVHDIAIQAREMEMVIGSHARSVWKFDLKPMLEANESLRETPLKLWPLESARRTNWGFGRRAPFDTSLPPSPTLSGRLWSLEAGEATVRIVDKDGKAAVEKRVPLRRGYNAFSLDLLLEAGTPIGEVPTVLPKTVEEALRDPYAARRGVYIAAGDYRVTVTLGDRTVDEKWTVTG
ncbi:MAG: hypothetical protein KIS66_01760 [Fimbriimonadaceae bacterium]|nr:hypothetical protein [Fimbriimonadaceae bacterium]